MTDLHPHLRDALAELKHAAVMSPEIQLILIVGPSGVGKSTLLSLAISELVGDPETWPDGEVRAASVVANKDEQSHFSLGVYYTDVLTELGNPFFRSDPCDPLGRPFPVRVDTSIRNLRKATRKALRVARCRYILLDEGNRLASSPTARVRLNNLDLIRHSVETSRQTKLVIAGTYEMLNAVNCTAQIDRRTHVVHLSRYSDSRKEIAEFTRLVDRMTERYALPAGASLVQFAELIYRVSLGCYGEAEKFLREADLCRIKNGDSYLTYRHLIAAIPTKIQLDTLAKEVEYGESRLLTKALDKDILARLVAEYEGKVNKETSKRKVGVRNPNRDPVGAKRHETVAA